MQKTIAISVSKGTKSEKYLTRSAKISNKEMVTLSGASANFFKQMALGLFLPLFG
jgi:hypothetical protein